MGLAREVGVPVCLPEPVEAELAAQFMRTFAAANAEISQAWRAMQGVFRRANAVPGGGPHNPTAGEARAAYERAVTAARQAHHLVQIARSERPVAGYFEQALAQSPPFDSEGRGFKDAVILMSVIDDLHRRAPASGLLVTRDADFRGVEALAESLGVRLIVRNADDAVGILRRRLDAAARASYAAAERQALELAQRELATLGQFITDNLAVSSAVLADPAEQLIRFLGVHISSIKGVQSDPPFSALESGERTKLTFTMRVHLHADVMPIPETLVPPATVKVGDTLATAAETKDRLVQILLAQEVRAQRGQKVVLRQVEIDADAVRTADGFEGLTPVAVRLKDSSVLEQIQDLLAPVQEQLNAGESLNREQR
jgi:hypothetical protein